MEPYIPFTDEQKHQANAVDLEDYLLRRGEKLLPSGRDKRLASDHSVTIRGSEWFDHDTQQGGHAIDFVRTHDGCSFQEAVAKLLGGEQGQTFRSASERNAEPQKLFALPLPHHNMRRVYAYLMKQRHIDRDIITHFARAGTLYEDAEYHNAVFVGTDEHGVPRHAQKRSTNSCGRAIKLNVEGSDARYSFHHLGNDGDLYVFEAPIDLMSYCTLHRRFHSNALALCCLDDRALSVFLREHGLPPVRFHSLRHTNASLLIAAHVPVVTVSGRLGHAKTSTTTDIYAACIRSSDAAAADALDNVFTRIHEQVTGAV